MAVFHVAIFGGGVAGLSAAHELSDRGFDVAVYEASSNFGGKARSGAAAGPPGLPEPGPVVPNEHGFRFFPRFYSHITDTMRRIEVARHRTAYDELIEASRALIARDDQSPIVLPVRFPHSIKDLADWIRHLPTGNVGLEPGEAAFFSERIWQLMTSCGDRVLHEYDRRSWWDFCEASSKSRVYQQLLVEGLTHTLVAAGAHEASTSAGGLVLTQLFYSTLRPGRSTDTLLDGPTNTTWLDPWCTQLANRGVRLVPNAAATRIEMVGGRIAGVQTAAGMVNAEYYLFAVPVEVMASLITPDMKAADPMMTGLSALGEHVRWMTGIQFYMRESVPIIEGHVVYINSPWSLTSISQRQFWKDGIPGGGAAIADILSVDVSSWETEGRCFPRPRGGFKTARECTLHEIVYEIWDQLKRALNVDGKTILRDEARFGWSLDNSIVFGSVAQGDPPTPRQNTQPLFINVPGDYDRRPAASTLIPNLFLASDFVQTWTNLATMEAANEAARRAVNAILADIRRSDPAQNAPYCEIWPLYEPALLAPFRAYDQWRYDRDLPWKMPPAFARVALSPFLRVQYWSSRASRGVQGMFTRRRRAQRTTGHPRALA